METTKFKNGAQGLCRQSLIQPDEKSINLTLQSSKKDHLQKWTVIIARFDWLKRNKLMVPEDIELANLCLVVKNGKLDRAYYSSTLTHVIKKQRYFFQILN